MASTRTVSRVVPCLMSERAGYSSPPRLPPPRRRFRPLRLALSRRRTSTNPPPNLEPIPNIIGHGALPYANKHSRKRRVLPRFGFDSLDEFRHICLRGSQRAPRRDATEFFPIGPSRGWSRSQPKRLGIVIFQLIEISSPRSGLPLRRTLCRMVIANPVICEVGQLVLRHAIRIDATGCDSCEMCQRAFAAPVGSPPIRKPSSQYMRVLLSKEYRLGHNSPGTWNFKGMQTR